MARRTIVAMLGTSPGASTAVWVVVHAIEKCFGDKLKNGWASRLKEIIPSYGESLIDNPTFCRRIRSSTEDALKLKDVAPTS
jgi:malate dehydrogenase (quinone)